MKHFENGITSVVDLDRRKTINMINEHDERKYNFSIVKHFIRYTSWKKEDLLQRNYSYFKGLQSHHLLDFLYLMIQFLRRRGILGRWKGMDAIIHIQREKFFMDIVW